jgi:hypothetical protein
MQQAFGCLDVAERVSSKGQHLRILDRVHYFRARWHVEQSAYEDEQEHLKKAEKEASQGFTTVRICSSVNFRFAMLSPFLVRISIPLRAKNGAHVNARPAI